MNGRDRLACLVALACPLTALAQLGGTLTENTTVAASGPEAGVPRAQRQTFDLTFETTADWIGSTIFVQVTPAGQAAGTTIRHAVGQPTGMAAPWGNLSSPVASTSSDSSAVLYDTFLAAPPFTDPNDPTGFHPYGEYATAGACTGHDNVLCRISSATEIRGKNHLDQPVPLPWIDVVTTPPGSFLGARLTLVNPAGAPDLVIGGPGTIVATVHGLVGDVNNTAGVPFHWDIVQVPEPAALVLVLCLAGANLARVRSSSRRQP